jgi:Domain of unknown function DUF29
MIAFREFGAEMSASDKREIRSRLRVILEHLLKLDHLTDLLDWSQAGWKRTLNNERKGLAVAIRQNPARRDMLSQSEIDEAYAYVVDRFERESPKIKAPAACPYSIGQIVGKLVQR